MTHPSDDQLATFVDDDSADDTVDVAAHVARCAACQQQVTTLRSLRATMHASHEPSVADDVLRRLDAPPWWARWRLPMVATASCAALACLFIWRAPTTTTPDGFVARGGHDAPRVLHLRNDDRDVVDGATVAPGSSWRADLHSEGEAIAVVAVDANGAVHWLRPTWTDVAQPPSCPAPLTATLSTGTETVAFALPTGPLVVRALRVPQPCDVPQLDAALSAGSSGGAVIVDEVRVLVRP